MDNDSHAGTEMTTISNQLHSDTYNKHDIYHTHGKDTASYISKWCVELTQTLGAISSLHE